MISAICVYASSSRSAARQMRCRATMHITVARSGGLQVHHATVRQEQQFVLGIGLEPAVSRLATTLQAHIDEHVDGSDGGGGQSGGQVHGAEHAAQTALNNKCVADGHTRQHVHQRLQGVLTRRQIFTAEHGLHQHGDAVGNDESHNNSGSTDPLLPAICMRASSPRAAAALSSMAAWRFSFALQAMTQ